MIIMEQIIIVKEDEEYCKTVKVDMYIGVSDQYLATRYNRTPPRHLGDSVM